MKLTKAQAARAAGISRTHMARLIASGRISAEKLDSGEVRVDASEVKRLWPDADLERAHVASNGSSNSNRNRTPKKATGKDETVALRDLVDVLKRDKERLAIELERHRIDAAEREARAWAERDRLLADMDTLKRQIAHHQQKPALQRPPQPPRRSLWARITGT